MHQSERGPGFLSVPEMKLEGVHDSLVEDGGKNFPTPLASGEGDVREFLIGSLGRRNCALSKERRPKNGLGIAVSQKGWIKSDPSRRQGFQGRRLRADLATKDDPLRSANRAAPLGIGMQTSPKCICPHCDGHMAYPIEMCGESIACPLCGEQVRLASFASDTISIPKARRMVKPVPVKYWVTLRSTEPSGPTTMDSILFWYHRGFLGPETMVCEVGAEEWKRLSDLEGWRTTSSAVLLRIQQDESDALAAAACGPMTDQQSSRIRYCGFNPISDWTEGHAGLFLDFLIEIDARKNEEYENRPLTPLEIDQLEKLGLAPEEFDSPLEAREVIDPNSEEVRRAKIKIEAALRDRFDEAMEALEFDSDLSSEEFQVLEQKRSEIFEVLKRRHRDFAKWSNNKTVKAVTQIVLELYCRC